MSIFESVLLMLSKSGSRAAAKVALEAASRAMPHQSILSSFSASVVLYFDGATVIDDPGKARGSGGGAGFGSAIPRP